MTNRVKILLIDDNVDDKDLCEHFLRRIKSCKYKLQWAEIGESGLAVIENNPPDCVLLDYSMPGLDGYAILEHIKARYPYLPVVMFTDREDEKLTLKLMNAGAFDYIPKSNLDGNILHNVIQSALGDGSQESSSKTVEDEKYKILIIDDSLEDRDLYVRSFKKITSTSYQLDERASGDEGIAYINKYLPDCVLLDYSMPGRDGVETLKHIRAKHPFLPVIMLTGQEDASVAVKVMKYGAQDYLSKSNVSAETLSRSVRLAIERCSLEKSNEQRRDALHTFGRALAHDLKEPLRMVRSFLKIIQDTQDLTPKNTEYFSHVTGATTRMDTLIDMVHSYAKLDAPNGVNEKADVSLCEALESAKANLVHLIHEGSVVSSLNESLSLRGNFTQIMQIFQNLVMNAIIHNDKETPIVEVSSYDADDVLVIQIADNGPGIPEAFISRAFDPFMRFSAGKKGSGLGLAICRKTIEYYGGTIWYEKSHMGGSSFKFTIPTDVLIGGAPQVAGDKTTVDVPLDREPQSLVNILLVEDDDLDIKLTKILLFERDGLDCNLLTAKNGEEALAVLTAPHGPTVDLVLLDINMPVMDGFEFLQNVRTNVATKQLPIIMCTTSTYYRDIERAKSYNVLDYINKPITLDKMRPSIENFDNFFFQETNGHTQLWKH